MDLLCGGLNITLLRESDSVMSSKLYTPDVQ